MDLRTIPQDPEDKAEWDRFVRSIEQASDALLRARAYADAYCRDSVGDIKLAQLTVKNIHSRIIRR